MIIDYILNPATLPSTQDVFLMSRRMERAGHEVNMKVMRSLERGDIKFVDGKIYRLCVRCMDYYELEEFNTNSRYIYGKDPVCKSCKSTERRIKRFGQPKFFRDSGMKFGVPTGAEFKLKQDNKDMIKHLLKEDEDGKGN
jgi:hypothetical protein